MNEKIRQQKKKAMADSKKNFLKPKRLESIHYGDFCFFEDIALWAIRPIRLLADAMDDVLDRHDGWEERDPSAFNLFLNDIQIKLDDLIEACARWDTEERETRQKQEAA